MLLGRRDYAILANARIETILGGAGEAGEPSDALAPIVRQDIDVVGVNEQGPDAWRTQIGGEPDWVQHSQRVFCPRCWQELVFVAALGSAWEPELVPEITINNGSGYQYYFACNACAVLSVFGQNT